MSALDDALALKRSGHLDATVIALEAVLAETPSHPVALAHLAEVQIKRRRLADASEALDRAEKSAGTSAFTARLRGDIAYQQQRWDEASQAYGNATALGEKGIWTLVSQARCRLKLHDLDGARGAASRAVERDPNSSHGWVMLGDIALDNGDLAEAESMYQRAHERAPGDKWAYAKLVKVRLLQLAPDRRQKEVSVLL